MDRQEPPDAVQSIASFWQRVTFSVPSQEGTTLNTQPEQFKLIGRGDLPKLEQFYDHLCQSGTPLAASKIVGPVLDRANWHGLALLCV